MTEIRRKLVVVGDDSCGKTSLVLVLANKPLLEEYIPTIYEDHFIDITVESISVTLCIRDTAGEKFE